MYIHLSGDERFLTPACAIKPDCPRLYKAKIETLLHKYGGSIPRYTSYPTALHFDANVTACTYRSWLSKTDFRKPLSLYLHIPFCEQLCSYCGCHTTVVHHRSPITDYVDHLISEILTVAEAIGAPASVSSVHFGGGTPNILSSDDLDRIFCALRRSFDFSEQVGIAAELDPRILTTEWIAAAARNGLTRASLGVQDVDSQVQSAINRVQPWRATAWAAKALREAGVKSLNLDLMYGLPRQTVATIRQSVEKVLELEPERIALFGYAHVPWMKPNQKLISETELPGSIERYDQQEEAADFLTRSGYIRVGLDHFSRSDDPLAIAMINGFLHRNFQGYTTDSAETLIGFGSSAISRLPFGYAQNAVRTTEWRATVAGGRLGTVRGFALSRDDRWRAEVIERLMCYEAVDLGEVAGRHRLQINDVLPEPRSLAPLVADGLAVLNGSRLRVTQTGRLFVRRVCALFDRYLQTSEARHSAVI
jgi:oxygen-independent coproporphyrinogen-3 oxidase